jgi:acetyl esterase/lipase
MDNLQLPGRLGNLDLQLEDDPRLDPRLLPLVQQQGMTKRMNGTKMNPSSPPDEITKVISYVDFYANRFHDTTPCHLSGDEDESEREVIIEQLTAQGRDGNEIQLHVFRSSGKDDRNDSIPTIIYMHGGSMVSTRTRNPTHDRWCTSLALAGAVVIAVDFRNAYGPAAYNPFPAGLNDCADAIKYLASHRRELRLAQSFVLTGESSGANLALSTCLKAKRECWLHEISGVFAISPYISNCWHKPRKWLLENGLQSAVENDGFFTETSMCTLTAHYYTPTEEVKSDPLAWPYHASLADLEGLPPHVITVAELDMLRDEAIAYARKLRHAGVEVVCTTNVGAVHAAEMFRRFVPDLHYHVVGSIVDFATRLARYET